MGVRFILWILFSSAVIFTAKTQRRRGAEKIKQSELFFLLCLSASLRLCGKTARAI